MRTAELADSLIPLLTFPTSPNSLIMPQSSRESPNLTDTRNWHNLGLGAGVQFAGWLRKRPRDRFGLAIAEAANGDRFLDAHPDRVRREVVIEATYLASLTPWVSIQPDVQVVRYPGMNVAESNAWVATLRFILEPFASMR